MKLPAAEWAPDLVPLGGGSNEIKNVYPVLNGYKPFQGLVPLSLNGLASAAKGYFSAHAADGSIVTYVGDSGHIYNYNLLSFTDVSRIGTPYASQDAASFWEFVQYGTRVIATTIENAPQYFDIGSSSNFADLAGSPPSARFVMVVRDFLVFANTSNSPSEVIWSGNNDSEEWTPETKESSNQILLDGGWINGAVGGEVGYIFQERQIVRMTYIGPPLHFQFDVVIAGNVTTSPYSVVRSDRQVFYVGSNGFNSLSIDGGQPVPIGAERVDRWFLDENVSLLSLGITRAALDPRKKLILWSFADNSGSNTTFNHVIGYQWQLNRWFHAQFDHELIASGFTEAVSLDDMDALYDSIDDVPLSLDSSFWIGGLFQLRGFSPTHQLGVFEGDSLEATIETTEGEIIEGSRSMVTNVRPLTDAAEATVSVASRERLANSPASTTISSLESNGNAAVLSSGRYHKIINTIPAGTDWTYWQGADIEAVPDGMQ